MTGYDPYVAALRVLASVDAHPMDREAGTRYAPGSDLREAVSAGERGQYCEYSRAQTADATGTIGIGWAEERAPTIAYLIADRSSAGARLSRALGYVALGADLLLGRYYEYVQNGSTYRPWLTHHNP